ncbi:hypothetical protein [Aquitalea aquatilis]|uniref:hypothetical protein n=1 Tax=Aquitalea aquatilis TaxID=1537400 RepID=UPI0010BDB6EC|nr:hypothetical protein [Aquitalea aquatilis]
MQRIWQWLLADKIRGALVFIALLVCCLVIRAWWPVSWKEEVQLESGKIISVRNFNWINGVGPWGEGGGEVMEWVLMVNGAAVEHTPPIWIQPYVPILIDRYPDGRWFIVATAYTCERMLALGKPYQPYTQFIEKDGKWQQVKLDARLVGRLTNLGPGIRNDTMDDLTLRDKKIARIKGDGRIFIQYLKVATMAELLVESGGCR